MYLVRRGGTFHFRYHFPRSRKELRLSLGTGYQRLAKRMAHALAEMIKFTMERHPDMTDDQVKELVRAEIKRLLDHDKEMRISSPSYQFAPSLPEGERLIANYLFPTFKPMDFLPPIIRKLFSNHGLDYTEDSREFRLACIEYGKRYKAISQTISQRHNPINYDYVHPDLNEYLKSPVQMVIQKSIHTLFEVWKNYKDERISSGEWKHRTPRTYDNYFVWIAEFFGDCPIDAINEQQMREFKEYLKNSSTKTGKNVNKNLSTGTINNILGACSSFFIFAKENNYIKDIPTIGKIKAKKGKKGWDKFSDEDIIAMFNPSSIDISSQTKAWMFWIPVLAAFTGARVEEISQLRCSDIKRDNGIAYINIEEVEGETTVKTQNANRTVPIHQFLERELGFLSFVQKVTSEGHTRIFPQLIKRDGVMGYGHAVSKWMSSFLKRLGIKTSKKVFHSWRHTFISRLLLLTDIQVVADIAGHETGLITKDLYGGTTPLAIKKETIDKLQYPGMDQLKASRFIVK